MESKIKISYPDSEKIYMYGEIYPDVKVGMRKVNLTPTVTVENGKQVITENAPVYVYDTSGAYSDPAVKNDLKKGLPITVPYNYYRNNDPAQGPVVRWRGHANLLFTNWLNYYVYQETPYRREDIRFLTTL